MNQPRLAMRTSSERGIAMITVLLVMMLMSALLVGFTTVVMSDQRYRFIDRDRSQSFYGAAAGIEKLTADLGNLFLTNVAPIGCAGDGADEYVGAAGPARRVVRGRQRARRRCRRARCRQFTCVAPNTISAGGHERLHDSVLQGSGHGTADDRLSAATDQDRSVRGPDRAADAVSDRRDGEDGDGR